MDEMRAELSVQVAGGHDSDPEELDLMSLDLRRELLELDVDSVVRAAVGTVPATAKSGGTSLSNILIVSLSNSTVLVAVVHLLGRWVKRGSQRKVTVRVGKKSIEIESASAEETAKLIESWLEG
jgi:Effector Associated Constant Component 1